MNKIIVIGGGPAGMFAAIAAAETGSQVILLEKNEKLGKKLFITGKGRCNITNAGDMDNLFANVMTNAKFLYSAFYSYDNQRVIDFFERNGLRTKTERGNRVFPVSDHSSDVIATLQKAAYTGTKSAYGIIRRRCTGKHCHRRKADRWNHNAGRCSDHCDRRIFLSDDRLYRGWLPFCKRSRTYRHGHPAVTGTVSRKRRLCPADAGTFIKKCGSTHFK